MSGELWVIRHGETAWSASGQHTSTTDLPLTPHGEQVAAGLRDRLAGVEFDLVLTSPLQRARHTAALAGFPDATVDHDLAEWRYGEYEGLTIAQIRERAPGWTIWNAPTPGGETQAEIGERMDRVVEKVRDDGGRVLAFSHGHASRVLTVRWLGLGVPEGGIFSLDTATVSVLGYEHDSPSVHRWNS